MAAWAVDGAIVSGRGVPYYEGWEDGANCWYEVTDLETLLRNEYQTDVRFIPAVVVRPDGEPVRRQRRLVQTSGADGLLGLRRLGYDVRCWSVVADLELELHRYRCLNRLQFDAAVKKVRARGLGLCSTRGGIRPIKVFCDSFPPEEYAARNLDFQAELLELFGTEYDVDASSTQWTRVYRTPWCKRDGWVKEPWIYLDGLEPYELEPISPERLTDCTVDEREYYDGLLVSDAEGLKRAQAYARSVPPPLCGTGRCRKTLWAVALQCHLFGCAYPDALRIVQEWIGRTTHDRREWTPNVIAETVRSALRSAKYRPGARLGRDVIRPDEDELVTRDVYQFLKEVADE